MSTELVGDAAAAERRAERIRLRLDTIADNYSTVLPMIREAIEKRDDATLGYRSVSEYVADRFGGALTKLGLDVRREVVRELTSAGMSSRAIAPVVGVTHKTVAQDARQVSPQVTPATVTAAIAVDLETGEITEPEPVAPAPAAPLPPIQGRDGKTYSRAPSAPPRRSALAKTAQTAGIDLRRLTDRLEKLADDDRLTANKEQVASQLRSHLTRAIEVCQDLLDHINN